MFNDLAEKFDLGFRLYNFLTYFQQRIQTVPQNHQPHLKRKAENFWKKAQSLMIF